MCVYIHALPGTACKDVIAIPIHIIIINYMHGQPIACMHFLPTLILHDYKPIET